jgi:hypothetical protein
MATDAAPLLAANATCDELNAWIDALPAVSLARLTAAVVRATLNQDWFPVDVKHNVLSRAIAIDVSGWAEQRLAVARHANVVPQDPCRMTRSKSGRSSAISLGIQSLPHELLVHVAEQLFPRQIQPRFRLKEKAKMLGRLALVAKLFQRHVAPEALSVVDEALRRSATWMAGRTKAMLELEPFDAQLYLTSLPPGSAALGTTLMHSIAAFNGPRIYIRFLREGAVFKRQGRYEIHPEVPTGRLLTAFCSANDIDSDDFEFEMRIKGDNQVVEKIMIYVDDEQPMEHWGLQSFVNHPTPEHLITIAVRTHLGSDDDVD